MSDYPPPAQDPLDVALARVLYPFVSYRMCTYAPDCGQWEEVDDHRETMTNDPVHAPVMPWQPQPGIAERESDAPLWCYRRSRRDYWWPVPAYGSDDGRMATMLDWYVGRRRRDMKWRRIALRTHCHPALHFVMIGEGWPVDDGSVERIGVTFALAARTAILAYEQGDYDGR
jgi:hypothetical protein